MNGQRLRPLDDRSALLRAREIIRVDGLLSLALVGMVILVGDLLSVADASEATRTRFGVVLCLGMSWAICTLGGALLIDSRLLALRARGRDEHPIAFALSVASGMAGGGLVVCGAAFAVTVAWSTACIGMFM